jgi:hypothetical protein
VVTVPLVWRATHDRSHVSQHVQSSFQGARHFREGSWSTGEKVVHTTLHNLWINCGPSSSAREFHLNTCESRSPLSVSALRRREADSSGPWSTCQPLFPSRNLFSSRPFRLLAKPALRRIGRRTLEVRGRLVNHFFSVRSPSRFPFGWALLAKREAVSSGSARPASRRGVGF